MKSLILENLHMLPQFQELEIEFDLKPLEDQLIRLLAEPEYQTMVRKSIKKLCASPDEISGIGIQIDDAQGKFIVQINLSVPELANLESITEVLKALKNLCASPDPISIENLIRQGKLEVGVRVLKEPETPAVPDCCSCMSQIYFGVTCKLSSIRPKSLSTMIDVKVAVKQKPIQEQPPLSK